MYQTKRAEFHGLSKSSGNRESAVKALTCARPKARERCGEVNEMNANEGEQCVGSPSTAKESQGAVCRSAPMSATRAEKEFRRRTDGHRHG